MVGQWILYTRWLFVLCGDCTGITWIVGDSIVFWAGQSWARSSVAHRDSTNQLVFIGTRGANIQQIKRTLMTAWMARSADPDVVILHIGSNDLGQIACREFRDQLESLWDFVQCLSMRCEWVWSDILPRTNIRNMRPDGFGALEKVRKQINRFARRLCARHGGRFLKHPEFSASDWTGLFISDGIHLSDGGNVLFLQSLNIGRRYH